MKVFEKPQKVPFFWYEPRGFWYLLAIFKKYYSKPLMKI